MVIKQIWKDILQTHKYIIFKVNSILVFTVHQQLSRKSQYIKSGFFYTVLM